MSRTLKFESPLGELMLVGTASALTACHLPGLADPRDEREAEPRSSPALERAAAQLREYFAGERREFDLPLAPRGTPFQQRVWDALVAIPFGALRSYGEIARTIGRPSASRAVGSANGKNPIAIIVPCHRVIGANGTLTGYAGGLPAKQWLLQHEQRAASELRGEPAGPVPTGAFGQQRLFA